MSLKCKHCDFTTTEIEKLRHHVSGKHKKEWAKHSEALRSFDNNHAPELKGGCPICPHHSHNHV